MNSKLGQGERRRARAGVGEMVVQPEVLERKAAGSSCGERANRASKAAPTYTFKANHAEAGLTFDSISIYIWRAEILNHH